MAATELAPHIVVDPEIRTGRPVIQGTRVPVDVVVGQMAAGLTAAGHRGVVLTRFPSHLPATMLVQQIVAAVEVVASENLDGAIVVIEPGRVRVRRAKART